MFDGAADQFHQFIAPRTTLPLHLSFPLHASATPNSFLPFDPYNPSHQFPFQTNLLHPLHPHKDEEKEPNTMDMVPSINNVEIQRDQRQSTQLTDSWTNDEVLALLRIRSSMENWFPQLTWEHVSRKLAELGFKKGAEKCKEKFEDESRYFDNIDDYGKNNYRFLSELEELCHGDKNPDQGGDDGVVSEKTHHLGGDNMGHALEENSRDIIGAQATKQCDGSDKVVEKSKERKRKRKDRFEMFKGFCESVVNKMMAQQEEIHNKLLDDMMKRDQEKFAREEAWKKQEMDKMNKELEIMAHEQAIAGDRHTTIIEFLKKCATTSPPSQNGEYKTNGSNRNCLRTTISSSSPQNPNNPSTEENNLDSSDTLLQVPSSSNSSPAPHNPTSSLNSHNNQLESNSVSINKATSTLMTTTEKDDVGRRWPRDEVLALINLRCTSLSNNNNEEKEGNNKAPLWERISQGMSDLGYRRSAKRCKEKWENINKYFRKTKDVNKKRSLDSRTCPYFHQLSCLYGQGKLVLQSERQGNHFNPTANTAQVPPDQAQADESSQVGSGPLIQYAC
ncbi:trihelix transcription factor GTL2-like [Abrus precatorius]|uniref:Trihelix transcription factor GTL2-like n=1 Tax=Abrus precatorius TaxID=3816 RepID=A0A8B8LAG6_ABRPR|nr:trihelix transcription factor GTL2-like [Abrus precatorius]